MMDLKQIDTETDFGAVYVNRDHVTHITKHLGDVEGEFSVVWLVSGKSISVQGTPAQVKNILSGA